MVEVELLEYNEEKIRKIRASGVEAFLQNCSIEWAPRRYGGFMPKFDNFGLMPIPSYLFSRSETEPLPNWQVSIKDGRHLLFKGRGFSGVLPEDFKILWTGISFLDVGNVIYDSLEIQIADRRAPLIDLGQLNLCQHPTIVFDPPLFINEECSFTVYLTSRVHIEHLADVVMLGLAAFKPNSPLYHPTAIHPTEDNLDPRRQGVVEAVLQFNSDGPLVNLEVPE